MRTYKVVLCAAEEKYVQALMNYLNHNAQIPILAMAYTSVKELYAYLSEHKVDLIFAEQSSLELSNTVNASTKKIRIYSCEEQQCGDKESIYKYSPASDYVHCMLQILSEEEQTVQSGVGGSCIAVYSPHGRSGKTMLAKALCEYYSRQNLQKSNCIYIGMEEYSCRINENQAMDECLYYIKQKVGNISMKLKTLAIDHSGYDYIAGCKSYEELRELSGEDLMWLRESIKNDGLYEYAVFDIGSGSIQDLMILNSFDVVYIPQLQDSDSRNKWRNFCGLVRDKEIGEETIDHWFPVYVDRQGITSEKLRDIERQREQGELSSMKEEIQSLKQ